MPRALPRPFVAFACLLGLAGPCAWMAAGTPGGGVKMTARSFSGDTSRGGAKLRAAVTPPDQQLAVGGAAMQAAEVVARAYWNADACSGQVEVSWTDQSQTINAVSSWKNPTDGYNNPGQNFDCTVEFNRDLDYDWPRFCTVLVHEFGHLTGHKHSPDPNDVMAAYYNRPLQQCQDTADPTAAPAPAPVPAPPVVEVPVASAAPTAPAAAPAQPPAARAARAKPTVKRHVRRHVRPTKH